MKRVVSVILSFVILLCITGCGSNKIIVDGQSMSVEDLKKEALNDAGWASNYYGKDIEYVGTIKKINTSTVYYKSATGTVKIPGSKCNAKIGDNYILFEDGFELWLKSSDGLDKYKIGDKVKVKSKLGNIVVVDDELIITFISASITEENYKQLLSDYDYSMGYAMEGKCGHIGSLYDNLYKYLDDESVIEKQ